MTHLPRLFTDEASIERVALGLLDRSLPKEEWTHEAHLAACLWIVTQRPDIDPDKDLRTIIGGYNAAVGGVNDDHNGYHETITRCFVIGVRHWLARTGATTLVRQVNGLLESDEGQRDWPLRFYSRNRLFSVEARRDFVAPDGELLPQQKR